jgi:hypothetical protein
MSYPEENWKSNECAYVVWFESHGNSDKLCWFVCVCVLRTSNWQRENSSLFWVSNCCVNHEVYTPTLSYVEKKPSLEALWHKHTISLAI